MTGKGVYTFSNGDRCVGTYVKGKKEDQGTMFYANGIRYSLWKTNFYYNLYF